MWFQFVFVLSSVLVALSLDHFEVEEKISKLTGLKSSIGWIGFVMIFNGIMLQHLGHKVMEARKLYSVDYPTMYATKENKNSAIFNCYQRAHQNTLEIQPTFLVFTYFAAQRFPLITAISSSLVIISRFLYASGYYTGNPASRSRGHFGYLGHIIIFGLTIINSLYMLDIDLLSLFGIKSTSNIKTGNK